METTLSQLSLSPTPSSFPSSSSLSCINVLDAGSWRRVFYNISSANDILSASFVCKTWRNSFDVKQLSLHVEKNKKRKRRCVAICFNIKHEWVNDALQEPDIVFTKSILKSKRRVLKEMKVKVDFKVIEKLRPINYNTYRKENHEPHKDGNSPIIIIDISYEGAKQRFDWGKYIIPQNLMDALVKGKKWEEKRRLVIPGRQYCIEGCGCGDVPKSYYPSPSVRLATQKEMDDLKL